MTDMIDETPKDLLEGEFDLSEAMQFLMEDGMVRDYATEYGEPGYSLEKEGGIIALGYWWCNRKECGIEGSHGALDHYAYLKEKLEEIGMEQEWGDEWEVIHGQQVGEYPNISIESLAYRTKSDSYGWLPSILMADGEYLTPADGIEAWIEYLLENENGLASAAWTEADLEAQGFEEFNCNYESGWFEGQTDDPDKIMNELKERMGETHDILPWLKENSQFYMKFCVFVREKPKCENCDKIIDHGESKFKLCDYEEVEGPTND